MYYDRSNCVPCMTTKLPSASSSTAVSSPKSRTTEQTTKLTSAGKNLLSLIQRITTCGFSNNFLHLLDQQYEGSFTIAQIDLKTWP